MASFYLQSNHVCIPAGRWLGVRMLDDRGDTVLLNTLDQRRHHTDHRRNPHALRTCDYGDLHQPAQ